MKILPTPQLWIEEGALNQVVDIVQKEQAQKIMIVTDPGLKKAGICQRLEDILAPLEKDIVIFDEVEPDPSIKLVLNVVNKARENKIDLMIGLGGGSSMDTAKVAAALMTNTKDISAYFGIGLLEHPAIPIVAIPTTAGTGSEVTPIAILSDEEEQLKKGIVANEIIPQYALLDPSLLTGLPAHVTAATGMDALTHAIESFTSIHANDYSDALALRAIELISRHLLVSFKDGSNIEARRGMLLGSLLAGMSFANAGVAAVHAFAYPLGGMFHIPHGLANSLMLPTIMKFNMSHCADKYAAMVLYLDATFDKTPTAAVAVEVVSQLSRDLAIPQSLAEVKIPRDAIQALAEGAVKVTRLLANNPREVTLEDAVELYTQAYGI